MIHFDQCPRCNGEWKTYTTTNYLECQSCNMSWQINHSRLWIYFSDNSYLYWHHPKNQCEYWYNVLTNPSNIILPILPYTISIEQLKKLIAFI